MTNKSIYVIIFFIYNDNTINMYEIFLNKRNNFFIARVKYKQKIHNCRNCIFDWIFKEDSEPIIGMKRYFCREIPTKMLVKQRNNDSIARDAL